MTEKKSKSRNSKESLSSTQPSPPVQNSGHDIINIENTTAPGLILKWTRKNWLACLAIFGLLFSVIYYKWNEYILQDIILKKEVEQLKSDLKKAEEDREKLKAKIKALDTLKETNKKETSKVRESLKNADSAKLKATLQDYLDRLKRKRGF